MRHTDYKQLDDGHWFISYEDDASRCVTGGAYLMKMQPSMLILNTIFIVRQI